jgi:hypothetical protein
MSVWPDTVSTSPLLASSDGALVSVSIDVDPRDLESLLEALAHVEFPINPQIYHDAAMVYHYPDGRERTEPATLVEFPAYAGHLEGLHRTLGAFGFDPSHVSVTGMLEELHAEARLEPAPPGAGYHARSRRKRAGLTRHAPLQ